jgi:spore maturation protein CgeB
MRVLSVIRTHYYGDPKAVEPVSIYLSVPLRRMGHEVEIFDPYDATAGLSRQCRTELLVQKIKAGGFDLVLYATAGEEPVATEALADLSAKFCIAAWNSDDDWLWERTRQRARHFTFMITTYPHIYEANRAAYPNLLLSQWGCLGTLGEFSRKKDIDFSFAGSIYRIRNSACRYLRRKAGLRCFGRGARLVNLGLPYVRGAFRIPWLIGPALEFEEVNQIWNRSRISYAPMGGGPSGQVLSLKARLFEMGDSGTMMLCEHSPNLERYYEPGRECVTFEGLEDCAQKARWYLAHETERARIAQRYRTRTLAEHTWRHRFELLLQQVGLAPAPRRQAASAL